MDRIDKFLNKLKAGSTISHLYQKDFVSFDFILPNEKGEQQAIANILKKILILPRFRAGFKWQYDFCLSL